MYLSKVINPQNITMKNIIFLLFIMTAVNCKAQSVTYKKVQNIELNNFIGSFFEYQLLELKESIVKTLLVSNPSGSARSTESDEVTNTVYISNCENGELLDCKLYIIENLIRIKVDSVKEDETNIIIQITSGNYNQRKSNILSIPKH